MFSQLWHTGRSSHSDNQDGDTPVSASVDVSYWQDPSHLVSSPGGWVQPSPHRALDISEIPGIVAVRRDDDFSHDRVGMRHRPSAVGVVAVFARPWITPSSEICSMILIFLKASPRQTSKGSGSTQLRSG
jgi:hypothetical protein